MLAAAILGAVASHQIGHHVHVMHSPTEKSPKHTTQPVLVIACDGGGMKGVISAELLARMGALATQADMYAGTSTGSILAAALSIGRSPREISALYAKHGREIFSHRDRRDRWSRLDELRRANYDHDGLISALGSKDAIGDARIGQRSRMALTGKDSAPHVLIPSYDLDRNRPKVWSSTKPRDENLRLADAVLCSCSAPTYFPTAPGPGGNRHVDGGVVANSPGMCAVAELLHEGIELDRIYVLSVGTGRGGSPVDLPDRPETYDAGLLGWAPDIVNLVLGGSELLVDYQLRQFLGERYCRVDVPLSRGVKMDDSSPGAIDSMRLDVERGFADGTSTRTIFEAWLHRLQSDVADVGNTYEPSY